MTTKTPTTQMPIAQLVGRLVQFLIPSLHGVSRISGTVKRLLPDGRLEVKAQQGGYFILHASEIEHG